MSMDKLAPLLKELAAGKENKLYSFIFLQLFIPSGLGSMAIYFLQQADSKIYLFVGIGILTTAILSAITGQILKFRLGKQELHITDDRIGNEHATALLKMAYENMDKTAQTFKETQKEAREHFLGELKEARDHYELKEKEIRDHYHDRLTAAGEGCQAIKIELIEIRQGLKQLGIVVTEDFELVLTKQLSPAGNERR